MLIYDLVNGYVCIKQTEQSQRNWKSPLQSVESLCYSQKHEKWAT
jgi:hypothetical protein